MTRASLSIAAAVAALTLILLSPVLASNIANEPGNYDVSEEKGWLAFVNEAAKGTGGTPINMTEFETRLNNNVKDSDEPGTQAQTFNGRKGLSSVEPKFEKSRLSNTEISSSPAPAIVLTSGAFSSVRVASGMLVVLAASCFALWL